MYKKIIIPKNNDKIYFFGARNGNRTRTSLPTRPLNVRVYQFRHSRSD